MRRVVLLFLILTVFASGAYADLPSDFTFRIPFTLNTSDILAGDVTQDFAIPIDINSLIDSVFWLVVQDDGDDVRFSQSDGLTEVDFYFEDFDVEDQNAVAWISITETFPSASNLDMFLYFGNDSVESGQKFRRDIYSDIYLAGWDFNEVTGTIGKDVVDDDVNNLVHVNTPSLDVNGMVDGAIKYERVNDEFSTSPSLLDNGFSEISLSVWFNAVDGWDSSEVVDARITEKVNAGGNSFQLDLENFEGRLRWIGADGASHELFGNTTSWTANIWYHAIVTYSDSANEMNMYVDGGTLDSNTLSTALGTIGAGTMDLKISIAADGFDGKFDSIRFYNRALTADEAVLIYSAEDGALHEFGELEGGKTDLNITTINGLAFSSHPVFGFGIDGNITVDFNVFQEDNARLTVDLNNSESFLQGTGTVIVEDANLFDPSLVAWWNFDNTDSNTVGGLGHSGTLLPSIDPPDFNAGRNFDGNSLDFNGDGQFVHTTGDIVPNLSSQSYSFSVWVNHDSIHTSDVFSEQLTIITSKIDTDLPSMVLTLRNSSYQFRYRDSDDDKIAIATQTASEWVHLVGIFDVDAKTVSLYKNAVLVQTRILVNGFENLDNTNLDIGIAAGLSSFDGKIDEVRIYNRVLTPTEVSEIFSETKPFSVTNNTLFTITNYTRPNQMSLSYPWDYSFVDDGNYSILGLLSSGIVTDFNASNANFEIANDVNLIVKIPINEETGIVIDTDISSFIVRINANGILSVFDNQIDENGFSIPISSDFILVEIDTNTPVLFNSRVYAFLFDDAKASEVLQPFLAPVAASILTTVKTLQFENLKPIPNVRLQVFKVLAEGRTLIHDSVTDGKGETTIPFIVADLYEIDVFVEGVLILTEQYIATATTNEHFIFIPDTEEIVPPSPLTTPRVVFSPAQKHFNTIDVNLAVTVSTELANIASIHFFITNADFNIYDGGLDSAAPADGNTYTANINDLAGVSDTNFPFVSTVIVVLTDGNSFQFSASYSLRPGGDEVLNILMYDMRLEFDCNIDDLSVRCDGLMFIAFFVILFVLCAFAAGARGILGGEGLTLLGLVLMGFFTFIAWVPLWIFVVMIFAAMGVILTRTRFLGA